jgi:lactate dehydrogenase-like 2-hydroxyacid dehydrogenase
MKVVAYSVKSAEKEPLAIANRKKHEITLISNQLTIETAGFAVGKDAVIITTDDHLNADVIDILADLGIKYIATRSTSADHIDVLACGRRRIKIATIALESVEQTNRKDLATSCAEQTILNLDKWQANNCLGDACVCAKSCDKIQIDPIKLPLIDERGN